MSEIITVKEFNEFLEATAVECFGSMEEFGCVYNELISAGEVE